MHYFPEFILSLRRAMYAPFQAGPLFSCVYSGENQTNQDLVKALGYCKACFKLEKMAEK